MQRGREDKVPALLESEAVEQAQAEVAVPAAGVEEALEGAVPEAGAAGQAGEERM